MHILVITGQSPYPPVSGGRKDVFAKLEQLIALGYNIHLLVVDYEKNRWIGQPWSEFGHQLESVHFFHRNVRVNTFFHTLPVQVVSRIIADNEMKGLLDLLMEFNIKGILCEGLFCMQLSSQIAEYLKVPIAFRVHNDEQAYFSNLALSENSWIKKILLKIESYKTGRFQRTLSELRNLKMLLSIEPDIPPTWLTSNSGIECRFLPAFCKNGSAVRFEKKQNLPHLLFVGSLDMGPNVEGLRWFLSGVWPTVLKRKPDCRLRIVGSNASEQLLKYLRNTVSCDIVLDQVDISNEYATCPIFINPTGHGAGISIKTVEAMRHGLPIVSTLTGARACALSHQYDSLLVEDDDVAGFTGAVLRLLNNDSERESFSNAVVKNYNNTFSEETMLVQLSDAMRYLEKSA